MKVKLDLLLCALMSSWISAVSAAPCAPDCPSINWIALQGGTFTMGDTREIPLPVAIPPTEVTVGDFSLSQSEVTVAQYAACVDAGACTLPAMGQLFNWGQSERSAHPINGVSWAQAMAFAAWVGARLPSESEWEYAARARGQEQLYPWGDEEPSCAHANFGGVHCLARTSEVCSHPQGNTAQGLCDLAGGLWEWVADDYRGHHRFLSSFNMGDPVCLAPTCSEGLHKVYKGGAYNSSAELIFSFSRAGFLKSNQYHATGFRIARSGPHLSHYIAQCAGPILPIESGHIIQRQSELYLPPTSAEQAQFVQMMQQYLLGAYEDALETAAAVGYSICRGTGEEAELILIKPIAGDGSALVVLREGSATPLIIGSPHPLYDATLESGTQLFQTTAARAYILSQTHRCANSAESGCDGLTSACGDREPYKESDMAHTERSYFQSAHEVISTHYDQDIFVNIHGMSREGVSLSNGTRNEIGADAPVARLATALRQRLPQERVTTCNSYEGAVFENHLCGTTNTQGRALNASPSVCTEAATSASERFIHLEQSVAVRAQAENVAAALLDMLSAED
ncbi:MAG: SUMF1/EgtB/PvdO family nonheme iron enzyme [Myxococcota bacterium]|nr:SUMF1/EgtB/PvdO family nonheme iron enzyme [Myxococcota bacterium]